MTKRRQQRRRIVPMMYLAAVTGGLVVAAGCTTGSRSTTRPASWTEQAKNDPFNYSPSASDEWPTVSGGGISHFDKNEFKRDMDHVLNP